MTEDEQRQIESSQRQHHEVLEHQDRAYAAAMQAEYALFAMLKPKLTQDGDQWRVLYGEDLQECIVGFGDTPHKAVLDWNSQWVKTLKTKTA